MHSQNYLTFEQGGMQQEVDVLCLFPSSSRTDGLTDGPSVCQTLCSFVWGNELRQVGSRAIGAAAGFPLFPGGLKHACTGNGRLSHPSLRDNVTILEGGEFV